MVPATDPSNDELQTTAIDAHTIAETVWDVARDRAEGRDSHRWIDTQGNVYREERKTGLVHIEELVDVADLMTGHPLPLRQDDDYEELREIVVSCLERTIEGERDIVPDGGIGAGDTLYTDDITGWEFCFGADADRYGDIRNELYQTPDGLYVHVCYHSDERVKLNDGTITTAHEVVQVGERIKTTLVLDGAENEEDDACADYLLGEGGVVEAHWRNTTVSLSSEYGLEGWVEDYDADALRGAGKHEITFEVELTDQR